MVEITKIVLEFLIVFLLVYIVSYIFLVKKDKKFNRKKVPANINYLIIKYNLDIVKLGYKRVNKTVTIVDSLIVSLLYVSTKFVDNIYIRLIICFILAFPLFAGSYHFIAMYYKKEEE